MNAFRCFRLTSFSFPARRFLCISSTALPRNGENVIEKKIRVRYASLPAQEAWSRVRLTAESTGAVVERYDDAAMDILTAGRAPFRVVELLRRSAPPWPSDYLMIERIPAIRASSGTRSSFSRKHNADFSHDAPKNLEGRCVDGRAFVSRCRNASDGAIVEAATPGDYERKPIARSGL